MTAKQKSLRILAGAALLLCLTGCGGLNAGHSISPLDFLLPGSGLFHLQNTPPRPLVETNSVAVVSQPAMLAVR